MDNTKIKKDNSIYFWDIARQKYVMLMLDTQEIKVVDKEQIKRDYYLKYKTNWHEVKHKLFLSDEYIKSRYLIFEPQKGFEWQQNGFTYRNTYIESNISLESRRERKKGLKRINKDLSFLEKYPHINALLNNICNKKQNLEYFINWLSFIFATKRKTGTAILFRGIQGTGKGVFWEQILTYFFGENYTQILDNDTLKSNFTPSGLEKSLFVLANEIKGDFRDGNAMYEKIKMYISDPTLRIEEKGLQTYYANNNFNMIFFSNNDIPLQIQGSDRRYTVFQTKSQTLGELAENEFSETLDEFIAHIKDERDEFLKDLVCFEYDIQRARVCLNTNEKERIYRASMTKIEILSDKCKKLDDEFFENDVCEILENTEDEEKKKLYNKYKICIIQNNDLLTIQNLIQQMRDFALKHRSFQNNYLCFLYCVFVDKNANQTKIGTSLNSHFGKSVNKRIGDKIIRIREIEEFKEDNFLNKIIPF